MTRWLLCHLSFHKPVYTTEWVPGQRHDVSCARPGCNWPYL